MGISLNAIRQFSGSGSLVLDAQGTGLQSSKITQQLRSFFNVGDARQKNAETLTAIHYAFLNDPRFATKDLQQQAAKLLADVRVDRAIDASQIKAIVKEMDRLADGTTKTLGERVKLQLAVSRYKSALQPGYGDLTKIIMQQVKKAAAAGKSPVDVAGIVQEVSELGMIARLSVDAPNKRMPAWLMNFAVRHLGQFIVHSDGTLRSDKEISDAVLNTCDFYRDAKAAGADSTAAFEFIDTVGKKLPKGLFATFGNHVRSLQDFLEKRLGNNPSDAHVIAIIREFANEVRFSPIRKADDSYGTPVFQKNDNTACQAVAHYEAKLMAANLPAAVSNAICRGLHAQSVQEVLEKAIYDGMTA